MNNRYVFEKDDSILIYGAATEGHILINRIKDVCTNIIGFVDKRADEIYNVEGFSVYSLDSENLNEIDEKTVVIIAVKNVFDHKEIAYNIQKKLNLKRLVFIPVNMKFEGKECVEETYNDLFYGKVSFPYSLPEISVERIYDFEREDYRVLKGEKVVIPVPISKVFTNNSNASIWNDINIAAYFPHIRLFQLYSGQKSGDAKAYIEFCKEAAGSCNVQTTQRWADNVIDNRKRVYDEMRLNYELEESFFIQHASGAIWNEERKYFNLTSGKHRAVFLASMNSSYIPLEVSLDDEKKWVNSSWAREAFDNIENGRDELYCRTIDNPYFYRRFSQYRTLDTSIFTTTVTELAEMLYQRHKDIDFSRVSYTCASSMESHYLALNLKALGCKQIEEASAGEYNSEGIDMFISGASERQKWDLSFSKRSVNDDCVKLHCFAELVGSRRTDFYLYRRQK